MRFDKNTWDLINSMYEILDKIKPCGEDNLHELWITIPRGNISDYVIMKNSFRMKLFQIIKSLKQCGKEIIQMIFTGTN